MWLGNKCDCIFTSVFLEVTPFVKPGSGQMLCLSPLLICGVGNVFRGSVCGVGNVFRFIPQPRGTPPHYEQALERDGGPWSSQLTSSCMEAPLLKEAGQWGSSILACYTWIIPSPYKQGLCREGNPVLQPCQLRVACVQHRLKGMRNADDLSHPLCFTCHHTVELTSHRARDGG